MSPLVYIMLYKWFFLFLGVSNEKIRKYLFLIERKAMGTNFEEEKRFNEVPGARKARLKGLGECIVGRALWDNHEEILQ